MSDLKHVCFKITTHLFRGKTFLMMKKLPSAPLNKKNMKRKTCQAKFRPQLFHGVQISINLSYIGRVD